MAVGTKHHYGGSHKPDGVSQTYGYKHVVTGIYELTRSNHLIMFVDVPVSAGVELFSPPIVFRYWSQFAVMALLSPLPGRFILESRGRHNLENESIRHSLFPFFSAFETVRIEPATSQLFKLSCPVVNAILRTP